MVGRGVDVIDTNAVDAKFLHETGVALALLSIDERVLGAKLVRDAWGNVSDETA